MKKFYLGRNILPPKVISILDDDTNDILDYSGNPVQEGGWKRRGMVMGHVQAGKTTNYSALICKAADAGYKIIIVLAGITNSLRRQTQERLDETFIGKKSVFQAAAQEILPILGQAFQQRFPVYGTSRDSDFSKQAAMTYGISLASLSEPIIFITKKNKTTLERLRNWLKDQHVTEKINEPLLLIDDEADNASINTTANPNQVTAINKSIREILATFSRSTYIGYTATPFANIFIDPESENEMLEDDLFPRDFIKVLDPPSNYVGALRVFSENGDLSKKMVVKLDSDIEDYETLLPLTHKKDWELLQLPSSLEEAIRAFVITRAVRVLRGQGEEHCSMMVNVSRFNDIQQVVHGLVFDYLEKIRNSIGTNAGLGEKALQEKEIKNISDTYILRYSSIEFSFMDLLPVLPKAINSILVKTINMKGGVLDYSKAESGLHVIAIGGLALSRGLTLEGLTVSYILRNASASDILMQMARWFGYRPNYEDICRLYIPSRSVNHYEFITDSIEELRSELKRMELNHMTPKDFGLRVRHDPTAIRITATNKMRTATTMKIAQDYSGRHVEGYVLYNNDDVNQKNLGLVKELLGRFCGPIETDKSCLIKRCVDAEIVFPFIRKFEFPEQHPDLGSIMIDRSLFVDYVSDRLGADLKSWDIAIPIISYGGSRVWEDIQLSDCSLRKREAGKIMNGKRYWVTGDKFRLANPGDQKIGLSAHQRMVAEEGLKSGKINKANCSYSLQRERPLLLIHVFNATLAASSNYNVRDELLIKNPVVSLSFCLPTTEVAAHERLYQVNAVYRDQMIKLFPESDDDEILINDEVDYV